MARTLEGRLGPSRRRRTVLAPLPVGCLMDVHLDPVRDVPALVIEPEHRNASRTLVVSDVHLGLGASRERPGGPFEGSSDRLADELVRIVRASRADRVLIAGDAKHPIVGTPPALRGVVFDFFSHLLGEAIPVELVLGNHDVGIVPHLPREVTVHPATGVVRDGVGIFHGHRWPSNAVLRASRLVAGHLHPGFRLAPTVDDPEGKRRCWVRVELPEPPPPPRRHRRRVELQSREIVILPAFNPIAGTEALNRDRPARGRSFLYRRFLARGTARAYLLDGTDLGPLTIPDAPRRRSRATSAAPQGR